MQPIHSERAVVRSVAAWPWWAQAVYAFLCTLGTVVIVVFGIWWFSKGHLPVNFAGWRHVFDYILFALLSYVVWYQLLNELFTWWIGFHMKHPVPIAPIPGKRVALLTAFVPESEPYTVLEQALAAMRTVTYPHDTWVLDEGDDATVQALCAQYGAKHFSRKNIARYNTTDGQFKARTKAGNYNAWFDAHGHEYEFVAQHDVDFVPHSDFLDKTLGYFRDPAVAFVGSPQVYGNTNDSWIARAAAEQAYGFYGPIQKGLYGQDMQLFIGANHVIRVAAHDDIGGYSGHIVEDHLTGMRLYARGWKSVFVPETLLVGEGPATWDAYFKQQMRWSFGLIDLLFKHTPRIAPKMRIRHVLNYLFLQHYYFFGLPQLIGISLIFVYFVFGVQSGSMDISTLLVLYPLFVIMQLVIFFWLQLAYIDPKRESGLHLRGTFLNIVVWPIYALAFISVMLGKRLGYAVTPKGVQQVGSAQVRVFTTQIVIGTMATIAIIASFVSGRHSPVQMFWALVTAGVMYFVVAQLGWDTLRSAITRTSKEFAHLAQRPVFVRTGVTMLAGAFVLTGTLIFNASLARTVPVALPAAVAERSAPAPAARLVAIPTTVAPAYTQPVPMSLIHVVTEGESLRSIAQTYYGDEMLWTALPHTGDPDLIHPGEEIALDSDLVS